MYPYIAVQIVLGGVVCGAITTECVCMLFASSPAVEKVQKVTWVVTVAAMAHTVVGAVIISL